MKRLCIQALVLCAMLTALTATAFADAGMVKQLNIQDENVTLAPLTDAGATITAEDGIYQGARKFQITLSGAQNGALYLAMIRTGDGVPTKDNLYWCDVVKGNDGAATLQANSSNPMSDGSYDVWITDDASERSVSKVASFEAGSIKMGCVVNQSAKKITVQDALYALYISVGRTLNDTPWASWRMTAANVDGDAKGKVTVSDAMWILQRAVGKRNDNWELVS